MWRGGEEEVAAGSGQLSPPLLPWCANAQSRTWRFRKQSWVVRAAVEVGSAFGARSSWGAAETRVSSTPSRATRAPATHPDMYLDAVLSSKRAGFVVRREEEGGRELEAPRARVSTTFPFRQRPCPGSTKHHQDLLHHLQGPSPSPPTPPSRPSPALSPPKLPELHVPPRPPTPPLLRNATPLPPLASLLLRRRDLPRLRGDQVGTPWSRLRHRAMLSPTASS